MLEELRQNKELWDLFTKKEEYNPILLDRFNRFLYYASKHRDVLRPSISEFFIKNGLEIQYPENKKFAVCLTHDIDTVYLSKIETIYKTGKLLKEGQIKEALARFKVLFSKKIKKWNLVLNFQKIIDVEKKYNAKSSFYFMARTHNFVEFNYDIADFKDELRSIVGQGWEVGLHGSCKAHINFNEIKKEKEKLEYVLGEPIVGYRNHGLHFKIPDTWEYLTDAGFKYDTTFGYLDMVGFRNGTCHPFCPFNLNTGRIVNILEIPLIVMDGTLFNNMQLNIRKAWKITKLLIDLVEVNSGVITISWHNTSFDEVFRQDWNKLYEKILDYCYEKNAWMTSGENIYNWWLKMKFISRN